MSASIQPLDYIDFYGETTQLEALLFCEALAERSQQHNWKILPHRHRYIYQLFFVAEGGGEANLDEQQQALKAPAVLLIPPGVMHSFSWQQGSQGTVLSVTDTLLQQALQKMGVHLSLNSPVLLPIAAAELANRGLVFNQLVAEQLHSDEYAEKMQHLLLEQVLVWLARALKTHAPAEQALSKSALKLRQFRQLVSQSATRQHQVAWYAGQIGVTQSHLNQICQRYAGVSALALIHRQLVNEAKRYLIFSDLGLNEIAEQLGFTEPGYFSKFFKRLTSQQPARYRLLNRG
jgi:AraC family transcriptional activator of pobA